MKKTSGKGFMLLWIGIWSLVTLGFDGMILFNAYRQIRAGGFATTEGVVTRSEVERRPGNKGGTTYALDVQYEYTVNGSQYTGDRYRYGQMSSSDNWAHQTARQHRVGSKVTVHYDHARPDHAVLKAGIEGVDLFMALFIAPFNVVMLGGLHFLGLGRSSDPYAEHREAWESRMRLPRLTPLGAAGATLLVVSFVSIFVVGFSAGFHPSLNLMIWWWIGMLGVAFAIAIKVWMKVQSGAADLVLDERRKMVTFPLTFGRKQPVAIKCDEITGVSIDEEVSGTSKGGKHVTHVVGIRWRDDKENVKTETVAKLWSEEDAAALASALRRWLKVREEEAAAA